MDNAPTYLDPTLVTDKRQTKAPHNRSRSGYGSKVPSTWQLRIGTRWHRVYVICWSNAGTAYVLRGGERVLLGAYDPGL